MERLKLCVCLSKNSNQNHRAVGHQIFPSLWTMYVYVCICMCVYTSVPEEICVISSCTGGCGGLPTARFHPCPPGQSEASRGCRYRSHSGCRPAPQPPSSHSERKQGVRGWDRRYWWIDGWKEGDRRGVSWESGLVNKKGNASRCVFLWRVYNVQCVRCVSTHAGVNNVCILSLKNADLGGAAVSQ